MLSAHTIIEFVLSAYHPKPIPNAGVSLCVSFATALTFPNASPTLISIYFKVSRYIDHRLVLPYMDRQASKGESVACA